jgi:hypothetical protein
MPCWSGIQNDRFFAAFGHNLGKCPKYGNLLRAGRAKVFLNIFQIILGHCLPRFRKHFFLVFFQFAFFIDVADGNLFFLPDNKAQIVGRVRRRKPDLLAFPA